MMTDWPGSRTSMAATVARHGSPRLLAPMQKTTIRMPRDLLLDIQRIAAEREISASHYIRTAVIEKITRERNRQHPAAR